LRRAGGGARANTTPQLGLRRHRVLREGGSVGWATDRKTSRDAKVEALRQCAHERCEVVAAVSRGCAALARNGKKHSIEKGVTRQEAESKALRRCGEKCEIAAWTCTR
jgi:hypothetical protein